VARKRLQPDPGFRKRQAFFLTALIGSGILALVAFSTVNGHASLDPDPERGLIYKIATSRYGPAGYTDFDHAAVFWILMAPLFAVLAIVFITAAWMGIQRRLKK
jgi:hypothetical protein